MAQPISGESSRGSDAARRYPPLLTVAAALAIALFVLPSSLNLPQANPATTVELAPIPPNDEDIPPPPLGNFSSLGLGTSASVETAADTNGDGIPDTPPPPDDGGGKGKTPTTKKCVKGSDGVVRQTNDPLSPPCVASFKGDNGGATYQGVTPNEIKILFYYDASIYTPTARGQDTTPSSTLVDVRDPPREGEVGIITVTRAWEKYFNDRYQAFGRLAHFFIYFGTAGEPTPQTRQADAAQAYSQVKPFATISYASLGGGADVYTQFMAQHGVLNFGSVLGRSEEFFQQFPKLAWGYPPSIEKAATGYIDFVCKKIVPYKTSFGGQGTPNGQPRKYGMLTTTDEGYPGVRRYYDIVKAGVKKCGANIVSEKTYPTNGYTVDNGNTPQYAIDNMTAFFQAGVTTILWPTGLEVKQSAAASQIQYFPEWVIAGDGQQDGASYGQRQDREQWRHAWLVSNQTKIGQIEQELCYQAYREVDRTAPTSDVSGFACPQYNDLRQLFTAIQSAGPKLGPSSVDKGMHAIPSRPSGDPRVPACFYDANDYTCVKDSTVMWWDPDGIPPNNGQAGCWRMAEAGKRYIFGQFPAGDTIPAIKRPSDPCNGYEPVENINPYPPDPDI